MATPQDQEEQAQTESATAKLARGGDGWTDDHEQGYRMALEDATSANSAAAAPAAATPSTFGTPQYSQSGVGTLPRVAAAPPRPTLGFQPTKLTVTPTGVNGGPGDAATAIKPVQTVVGVGTGLGSVTQEPTPVGATPPVGGTQAVLPQPESGVAALPRARGRNQKAITSPALPQNFFSRK